MRSGIFGLPLSFVQLVKQVKQAVGHGLGLDDVVKGFQLATDGTIRIKRRFRGRIPATASFIFTGLDHGLVSIACRRHLPFAQDSQ